MLGFGIILAIILAVCISIISAKNSYLNKVCKLNVDPGKVGKPPGPPTKMFFFNSNEERCRSFLYLGSEGNENKFSSSDDCIDSCQTPWLIEKDKDGGSETETNFAKFRIKADCQLPKVEGTCKALIPQWYFYPDNSSCLFFQYGGCNGNHNRFDSEKECEQFCK